MAHFTWNTTTHRQSSDCKATRDDWSKLRCLANCTLPVFIDKAYQVIASLSEQTYEYMRLPCHELMKLACMKNSFRCWILKIDFKSMCSVNCEQSTSSHYGYSVETSAFKFEKDIRELIIWNKIDKTVCIMNISTFIMIAVLLLRKMIENSLGNSLFFHAETKP